MMTLMRPELFRKYDHGPQRHYLTELSNKLSNR